MAEKLQHDNFVEAKVTVSRIKHYLAVLGLNRLLEFFKELFK